MVTLVDAFNALEERKKAVLGIEAGTTFSSNPQDDSLIMSGFDLQHGEVDALGSAAGNLFYIAGEQIPLPIVIKGAWVEGLLIGLMYAQLKEQENKSASSG